MRHRHEPRWPGVMVLLAAVAAVGLLWWAAPGPDDAMEAVERERAAGWVLSTPDTTAAGDRDSLTSVRAERNRRYEIEALLEDTTRALRACRQDRARLEAQ